MPSLSLTHTVRAAGALLCCCAGTALCAAPAHAAYTDYRCATLAGTGETYADAIVMAHVPPSPIVGVNCRPITGDGSEQILLYGGKDGLPGFRCTSFTKLDPLLKTGVGANCKRVVPENGGEPAQQQDRSAKKTRKAKSRRARTR